MWKLAPARLKALLLLFIFLLTLAPARLSKGEPSQQTNQLSASTLEGPSPLTVTLSALTCSSFPPCFPYRVCDPFTCKEWKDLTNQFLWIFGDGETSSNMTVDSKTTHTYRDSRNCAPTGNPLGVVSLVCGYRPILVIFGGDITNRKMDINLFCAAIGRCTVISFPSYFGVSPSIRVTQGTKPPSRRVVSIQPSADCSIRSPRKSPDFASYQQFTSDASLHGVPPFTFHWDFNDPNLDPSYPGSQPTSTEAEPYHMFHQPGYYNVTLSVRDSASRLGPAFQNNTWETWRVVPVSDLPGPIAWFDWRAPTHYWFNPEYNGTMDANPAYWSLEFDASPSCVTGISYNVPTGQITSVSNISNGDVFYDWDIYSLSRGSRIDTVYERASPTFTYNKFPEQGKYNVTLTVRESNRTIDLSFPTSSTYWQIVEVKDILMVSMGDSVASGQGSPDVPQTIVDASYCDDNPCVGNEGVGWGVLPPPPGFGPCEEHCVQWPARWEDQDKSMTKYVYVDGQYWPDWKGHPNLNATIHTSDGTLFTVPLYAETSKCNRSQYAYGSLAAMNLEEMDPHTSVTFIHVACSGASIIGSDPAWSGLDPNWGGLLSNYTGTYGNTMLRPQIDQIADLVKGRQIDYLAFTVGGNDVHFADVVADCGKPSPDFPLGHLECDNDFHMTSLLSHRLKALPHKYDMLAANITARLSSREGLPPAHIYAMEYIDPVTSQSGNYCDADTQPPPHDLDIDNTSHDSGGYLWSLGDVSGVEARWAERFLLNALSNAVYTAALAHGWEYVGDIARGYIGHGYCAGGARMSNTIADSLTIEGPGPCCDMNDLTTRGPLSKGNVHPNYNGHQLMARRLLGHIKESPLPLLQPIFAIINPKIGNENWIWGSIYSGGILGTPESTCTNKKPDYCSDHLYVVVFIPGPPPVPLGAVISPVSKGLDLQAYSDECPPSPLLFPSGVKCGSGTNQASQSVWLLKFDKVRPQGVTLDGDYGVWFVPSDNPQGQLVWNFSLKVDLNDPIIATNVTYARIIGNEGWYRSEVRVREVATDFGNLADVLGTPSGSLDAVCFFSTVEFLGGSGISSAQYTLDDQPPVSLAFSQGDQCGTIEFVVSGDGVHTVTGSVQDIAGRSGQSSATVKIDMTPPTITGSPTTAPDACVQYLMICWYRHDVTVHFSAADATSGIASVTPDTTIATEGTTEQTQFVTGTATDHAGNFASTTVGPFYIDKTPPTIVSPQANQNYILHEIVPVSVSCTDSLSGIAFNPNTRTNVSPCSVETGGKGDPSSKCSKPNPLGVITLCLDTSTVGPHSYTVSAMDNAGNMNSTTIHYNVIYKFQWISPASGSSFQPNSQVIVRFRLVDALGNSVNSTLPPKVWVDCPPKAALSPTFCVNGLIFPNPAKTANCAFLHFAGACSNNATYVRGTGDFTFKLSTFGLVSSTGVHYVWVTLDDGTAYSAKINAG